MQTYALYTKMPLFHPCPGEAAMLRNSLTLVLMESKNNWGRGTGRKLWEGAASYTFHLPNPEVMGIVRSQVVMLPFSHVQ